MKTANWLYDTLPVIVLYKTNLADSVTFQSLKEAVRAHNPSARIDILVCDNSPTPQVDVDEANSDGLFNLEYLHDPQNPGVSQSYNRGATLARAKDKKWLFVLDQDTTIPADAVLAYQQAISAYPNQPVYAPQLYNGSLLFSPCRFVFGKGSNLPCIEPGVQSMRYRNVLNSGLLIDLGAFWRVGGYDETVRLYFSDFVFFNRLKKHYQKFVVVDCRLAHQLSSVDYSNRSFALNRFAQYCTGAWQASRRNGFAYLNQGITVGLRSLLMSWRFKTLLFLWAFIQFFVLHPARLSQLKTGS